MCGMYGLPVIVVHASVTAKYCLYYLCRITLQVLKWILREFRQYIVYEIKRSTNNFAGFFAKGFRKGREKKLGYCVGSQYHTMCGRCVKYARFELPRSSPSTGRTICKIAAVTEPAAQLLSSRGRALLLNNLM